VTVAIRKAAGEAKPPPSTVTGTLNSIAAIGAAPVTMQNSTPGSPSAFDASLWSARVSATSPNSTSAVGV
jgi:hypothetical protein